ncbi:MAG: histidine phosphatase family protein [Bacteroidia bacterium]|nr:histidine phosphatase family protein [Bacteroidia bacterium]
MSKKILLYTLCFLFLTSCVDRKYEDGLTINKIENGIIYTADERQIPLKPKGYENATVIALARHTEAIPDQENPGLSDQGLERADRLAAVLLPLGIQEVYMTSLKRTIFTARPLAMPNNIKVFTYDTSEYEKVITRIMDNYSGQHVAIYGHSNTTPAIINLLIGEEKYVDIPHDEYDNLFLVFHNGEDSEGITDAIVYQFKY